MSDLNIFKFRKYHRLFINGEVSPLLYINIVLRTQRIVCSDYLFERAYIVVS